MKFHSIVTVLAMSALVAPAANAASTAKPNLNKNTILVPKAHGQATLCSAEVRTGGNTDKESIVDTAKSCGEQAGFRTLSSDEAKAINADRVSKW